MPTVRIVVRGRVQGVGFRFFVKNVAESFGVSGSVWNRFDGGVELVGTHADPERLSTFVEAVRFGPGLVESLEATSEPDPPPSAGFVIGSNH